MLRGHHSVQVLAAALRSAVVPTPNRLLILLGASAVWFLTNFINVWLKEEWESISEVAALALMHMALPLYPADERAGLADEFVEYLTTDKPRRGRLTHGITFFMAGIFTRLQIAWKVMVFRSVTVVMLAGLVVLHARSEDDLRIKWMRTCVHARRSIPGGKSHPRKPKPGNRPNKGGTK